jgi:hypothetical protein
MIRELATHFMPMWWDEEDLGVVCSCGNQLGHVALIGSLWFCFVLLEVQGQTLAIVSVFVSNDLFS